MTRLFLLVFPVLFTQLLNAQFCGTDQLPLLERVVENQRSLKIHQRGAVKYVPVTFHLVASAAGTGRVLESAVLNQLCALNNQYADQEVIFYIDRLNYFDNDAVYNTPSSTAANTQMRLRRDNNSINVYITNTANSGNGGPGVTLAYYDGQEDWIVSRKDQIGGSKTLAHEMGHFFSLPHPHAGWDCVPYTDEIYGNPVTAEFTMPCENGLGSLQIELQDGSNCATAGDKICDTPPDYNIGLLHQNGCADNTFVKDKNGQIITPITGNFMSYYTNCASHSFTPTQKSIMNTDFFTPRRNYIRTGKVPNTDSVEAPVTYITPINGEITPGFTNILFDWEDTPGATHYLVIVDRNQSFTLNPQRFIVNSSQLIIDELPIHTYYWRVWPYNESQTCAGYSPTQNFRVGAGVGVNEIKEVGDYSISPNPVHSKNSSLLTLTSLRGFDAKLSIMDAAGRVFVQRQLTVAPGLTQHQLETQDLPSGIYFVMLHSHSGILVERLFVMQ